MLLNAKISIPASYCGALTDHFLHTHTHSRKLTHTHTPAGYDYSRYQSAEYPRYPSTADPYMAYQAAAGYTDRSAAAGYPGYPTGYRGGYDMSAYAGMYGGTASVGTYQQQTASNYGPARFGDVSKDRGAKSAQFHPYRR